MAENWFKLVSDELRRANIDKKRHGPDIARAIRDCWLDEMTPEAAAKKISKRFQRKEKNND